MIAPISDCKGGCSLSDCLEGALVGVFGVLFQQFLDEVGGAACWEGSDAHREDNSVTRVIAINRKVVIFRLFLFG